MPNGRCYRHGGATPTGVASPHFKHGRYSKDVPARLTDKYDEARSDPELLAMAEDIALIDARLGDVLGRVDTGESGELWLSLLRSLKEVQKQRRAFDRAMHCDDQHRLLEAGSDLNDALDCMEMLAQGGVSDYAAWAEVKDLLERRRKLVDSESKRLMAMQQLITAEKAMNMLGAVVGIIRTHVPDREALSRIGADIRRLLAGPTGG